MSRDALKSLLDEMLTEADERLSAQDRAAREAAREPPPPAPAPAAEGGFTDVEQLRALGDVPLCRVLAAAKPDDLLTVLSSASDGLRRRLLTNLSADSVRWLHQNLEYFDEPTRALLEAGRTQLLKVANRLLAEGAIALPGAEPEAGAPVALPEDVERVGAVLAELLGLVQRKGLAALDEVASGGDPLLDAGIALLRTRVDEATLLSELAEKERALLAEHARRLAVVRAGVLALAKQEDPEAFRRRLADIGR